MKYLRIEKTRDVNTYAALLHTSWCLEDKGTQDIDGCFHQFLASLVFTAFSLEAYLNHIGEQLFAAWDDLEHLPPRKKLNIICEKIGVAILPDKRPWQTVQQLLEFRNALAHGKSLTLEEVTYVKNHPQNEDAKYGFAKTEWEKMATAEAAKKCRNDVKMIIQSIQESSGIEDLFLLCEGSQMGSISLVETKGTPKTRRLPRHSQ